VLKRNEGYGDKPMRAPCAQPGWEAGYAASQPPLTARRCSAEEGLPETNYRTSGSATRDWYDANLCIKCTV
jgi:hypothetical protein